MVLCPANRVDALEHLGLFLPAAEAYAEQRNAVLMGHPNVSRISPALRTRLITELEAIRCVIGACDPGKSEKFIQEISWRLYWKSWLEQRPSVWTHYRERVNELKGLNDAPWKQDFKDVTSASSGVSLIDQWTSELITTGYLHNHVRMWYAAWWVHHLGIPWELGADFFLQHLLDGDPASNTLSWRWVAGLHTRGKTYQIRASNIRRHMHPDLLHGHEAALQQIGDAGQPPPVDGQSEFERAGVNGPWISGIEFSPGDRVGLLIHEDDVSPGMTSLSDHHFDAILILRPQSGAPEVRKYRSEALEDAGQRAAGVWSSPHGFIPELSADPDDTAVQLKACAENHNLTRLVAIKPFTGPTMDCLNVLSESLRSKGLPLEMYYRDEDRMWLNLAGSGFFGFWKKLSPQLFRVTA